MIELCDACGGESVLVRQPREVLIGQRAVTVDGEFMRCRDCEQAYFLPGQADALQRTAVEQIRREDGLLTPGEIRSFRERLKLSQADFERLLGTGPKTVVRWERGTVTHGGSADTLLRVLIKNPEALHDLALERGVKIDSQYFGESRVASEPMPFRLLGTRPPVREISLRVSPGHRAVADVANASSSPSA